MDSMNVDLREKGLCRARRCIARLCGGNLSHNVLPMFSKGQGAI